MTTLPNEFSWSRSRDKVFKECHRRYYFQYYGAWNGWEATAEERARLLYRHKKFTNRWAWVGDRVHKAIEKLITTLRIGGELKPDAAQKDLREVLTRDLETSQRGSGSNILVEHALGPDPGVAAWRECLEKASACLAEWFRSPYPDLLKNLPPEGWLPREELDSFDVRGVRVFVKLDLAFSQPGRVQIVDWKTGKDQAADPIQLPLYAAYAMHKKWATQPHEVLVVEYNLQTGHARETAITQSMLDGALAYVNDSSRQMLALLDDVPEPNHATESNFPVADTAATCRYCVFKQFCADRPRA